MACCKPGDNTKFDAADAGKDSFAGQHSFGVHNDWGANVPRGGEAEAGAGGDTGAPPSGHAGVAADGAGRGRAPAVALGLPPGYKETAVPGVYEFSASDISATRGTGQKDVEQQEPGSVGPAHAKPVADVQSSGDIKWEHAGPTPPISSRFASIGLARVGKSAAGAEGKSVVARVQQGLEAANEATHNAVAPAEIDSAAQAVAAAAAAAGAKAGAAAAAAAAAGARGGAGAQQEGRSGQEPAHVASVRRHRFLQTRAHRRGDESAAPGARRSASKGGMGAAREAKVHGQGPGGRQRRPLASSIQASTALSRGNSARDASGALAAVVAAARQVRGAQARARRGKGHAIRNAVGSEASGGGHVPPGVGGKGGAMVLDGMADRQVPVAKVSTKQKHVSFFGLFR